MADVNMADAVADVVTTLGPVGAALIGFAAGGLAGLFHFQSLWWNTRAYTSGGHPLRALALQLLRFAMIVLLLTWLARLGVMPLLAGALGILASRSYVLRDVGGVS